MYHGFYHIAVFEELDAVDACTRYGDLLERFGVHEVVSHLVLIEVLIGTSFYSDLFDLDAAVPGLIEDTSCSHVLEFGADESRAFAGLDVKDPISS